MKNGNRSTENKRRRRRTSNEEALAGMKGAR